MATEFQARVTHSVYHMQRTKYIVYYTLLAYIHISFARAPRHNYRSQFCQPNNAGICINVLIMLASEYHHHQLGAHGERDGWCFVLCAFRNQSFVVWFYYIFDVQVECIYNSVVIVTRGLLRFPCFARKRHNPSYSIYIQICDIVILSCILLVSAKTNINYPIHPIPKPQRTRPVNHRGLMCGK